MHISIGIVGGTFDDNGGRPSGYVNKLVNELNTFNEVTVEVFNGGYYNEIDTITEQLAKFDVIFWWVNIPNDKEKKRNIKSIYPYKMLVMSKRNNDEYSFATLINRALGHKANLMIDFKKVDNIIYGRIFDPLGSVHQDYTDDINVIAQAFVKRLNELKQFTRQSVKLNTTLPRPEIPDKDEFFRLIKNYAETFHALIEPEETVTRFLGNASYRIHKQHEVDNFRCTKGFPSFRDANNIIFVSRRNIDKRFIEKENFVPTYLDENDNLYYWGEFKPSVDTPVQVRLYKELPNINYMIHAHVYINNSPFTSTNVPCGAIEEVDEVLNVIDDKNTYFKAVNLIGHGCIIMANNIDQLKNINYVSRKMPEVIGGIK